MLTVPSNREVILHKLLLCFYFPRLRIEKQARIKARKISLARKKEKYLQKKFPHLSEAQKSSAA